MIVHKLQYAKYDSWVIQNRCYGGFFVNNKWQKCTLNYQMPSNQLKHINMAYYLKKVGYIVKYETLFLK